MTQKLRLRVAAREKGIAGMRVLTVVLIAVPVVLVGGLGAGFLSLGINAVPPAQATVHKDFPAGRFAATPAAAPLSSLMPAPQAANAHDVMTTRGMPPTLGAAPAPATPAPAPAPAAPAHH